MSTSRLFSTASRLSQAVRGGSSRSASIAFPESANADRPQAPPGRRIFKDNSMVAPHNLTYSGLYDRPRNPRPPLLGPKARDAKLIDPFYISRTNPLDNTYHPRLANVFTNALGRIKGRAETGLTWKSQRMMGKLIRRQRAMGIIPKWSNRISKGGYGYDEIDYSRMGGRRDF